MLAARVNSLIMCWGKHDPALLLRFIRQIPLPVMNALRMQAFRRTIRLVGRRSPFYQRKFAAAGIDPARVRSLADLKGLETTTAELRAADPADLCCAPPQLVFESSGTSGHVTRVYYSYEELDYYAQQGIILFGMLGLTPKDRIFGSFGYWASLYTERVIAKSGFFGIVPGLMDPREALDQILALKFTVVIGDPFWIARLTEVAQARGVRPPMTAFVSAAERLTDHLRGLIEAYWQAPVYMNYSSTELGASLGAECPAKAGYHLHEYDYAVEVVDPDSEGYGEIVFTTLTRTVQPLIRYRTGDIAKLIEGPCACGLPFRRLSLIRGRTDEVLACVWGDVHPDMCADLLRGAPGIGDEWQVALTQPGLRPVFEFRLEGEESAAHHDAIQVHLRRRLAEGYPLSWTKTEQQMVDIAVRFVPPGSLRTRRKLRRLVDERDQPISTG
jgi:phenylacetate-CoA ligase